MARSHETTRKKFNELNNETKQVEAEGARLAEEKVENTASLEAIKNLGIQDGASLEGIENAMKETQDRYNEKGDELQEKTSEIATNLETLSNESSDEASKIESGIDQLETIKGEAAPFAQEARRILGISGNIYGEVSTDASETKADLESQIQAHLQIIRNS